MSGLTENEREALAKAVYSRKVAWARTAITPWNSLRDFQREQQRIPALEQVVEEIVADHEAQICDVLKGRRPFSTDDLLASVTDISEQWADLAEHEETP